MIDSRESFRSLLEKVNRGDAGAAEQLVHSYGPHVVRAIRRRIRSRKMKVLYNTDDCMQSMWGSVFAERERIAKLESPDHLVKYLARVACNKLVDQDRHLRAQRNDVYRECALPGTETGDRFGLAAGDPTPSQQVAVQDEWEHKTSGLSSEKRTILELHRQGHSSEEIAAQMECSGRGIRRILQRFRELFGR